MAYVKNVWETGDTITEEKLNHMEGGIESGGLLSLFPVVINRTEDENVVAYSLDKTPQEVKAAILAGKMPVLRQTFDDGRIDMALIFPSVAEVSDGELYVIWATPTIGTVDTTAFNPPSGTKVALSGQRVVLDNYALVVEWIQGESDGQFGTPTKYTHEFS